MKVQSIFASVRSLRSAALALPLACLLCAAPLTTATARAAAPAAHLYLFDPIFGMTDVTNTYDGASVVSVTGEVVFVSFVTVPDNDTSAGQHTTDLTGPNNDTSAGQHTTDIMVDDATSEVVGFVAP